MVEDYDDLATHRGHQIVCVGYGAIERPDNVTLECETCGEVLLGYDAPPYEPFFDDPEYATPRKDKNP